MAFTVGQRVVCVNASGPPSNWGVRTGEIYTVAVVDREFVALSEIPPKHEFPVLWYARRFRPLVERKTDIAIFTRLLTPKKQRVRA